MFSTAAMPTIENQLYNCRQARLRIGQVISSGRMDAFETYEEKDVTEVIGKACKFNDLCFLMLEFL